MGEGTPITPPEVLRYAERTNFARALDLSRVVGSHVYFSGTIVKSDDIGGLIEVTDIASQGQRQQLIDWIAKRKNVPAPAVDSEETVLWRVGTLNPDQRRVTAEWRDISTVTPTGYIFPPDDEKKFFQERREEFQEGKRVVFRVQVKFFKPVSSVQSTVNTTVSGFTQRLPKVTVFSILGETDAKQTWILRDNEEKRES